LTTARDVKVIARDHDNDGKEPIVREIARGHSGDDEEELNDEGESKRSPSPSSMATTMATTMATKR
jgi:hypothetical protein